DCEVGRRDRAQPIRQRGDHQTIDVARKTEAVRGPRRDEERTGGREVPCLLRPEQFPLACGQREYLEEGVVPMHRDLPIVQVRTLGDRLTVQPEIAGLACSFTIKAVGWNRSMIDLAGHGCSDSAI